MLVGKEAPDFKAKAYYQDEIKEITLSSFRGQWVVLCFYPGDFTFV
jgi:alkyl hydroperoxide reductase subunit AhpC